MGHNKINRHSNRAPEIHMQAFGLNLQLPAVKIFHRTPVQVPRARSMDIEFPASTRSPV